MWKAIFLTGLLAGFLDGAAALLLFVARGAKRPLLLFQYIASAVYGNHAFTGGRKMIIAGVLFHLGIAMTFITFYFLLFPHVKWLGLYPLVSAVLYGLLVWLMMNRIVVPLSRAQARPFSWAMVYINMVILILTIGIPAAYIARWFYKKGGL
jgi:hypothetical protein